MMGAYCMQKVRTAAIVGLDYGVMPVYIYYRKALRGVVLIWKVCT
jgi:hypothetical protein